jgi:hypothetical protein
MITNDEPLKKLGTTGIELSIKKRPIKNESTQDGKSSELKTQQNEPFGCDSRACLGTLRVKLLSEILFCTSFCQ